MSSTLQLVKAPLLVLAASVIHFATTPPHPPAAPTEQVKSNFLEDFLRVSSPRGIVHFSLWAGALVEVASIFLMTYPPPPKSLLYPLSQLLRTENPRGIRVTIPFLLGVFLSCSGAYLRWACYRALGRFFTFEMSLKKDHRLIKDGPYSFVRHPGYLAILVTITGGFLTFASPVSLFAFFVFLELARL
ncbi:hypothetical protein CC2G_009427 [Coprinopsis cinerea AmutBmut pab1-1]|nr:hypothetical protein CC2G_009427 [Coprinopsis cinerea AmutBmut pab1-1]